LWHFLIILQQIFAMTEITDYLNNDYKAFNVTETVASVQDFFDEVHFSHFPVVEESVFLGCISGEDVETFDREQPLSNYRYAIEGFFARKTATWLDVLEIFARHESNLCPVLDENNLYVGYYEITDIIRLFNETPFIREPGGIIVVEKNLTEYSMSQIAQIVESNNIKLLGLFISEATADTVRITVKTTLGAMNEIIQTFRRYNYNIISEHQEDTYLSSLKERSAYLDKYLNM